MARSGAVVKNIGDGSGIGDTVFSMLTEPQFQAERGTAWILADGRNVSGSRYAVLKGTSTVPDMRDVVPRGKGNGRGLNPSGDLALGTFQSDQNLTHNHGGATSTDGAHIHSSPPSSNGNFATGPNKTAISDVVGGTAATVVVPSNGSSHAHGMSSDGGAEARVKSVIGNFFIKIN